MKYYLKITITGLLITSLILIVGCSNKSTETIINEKATSEIYSDASTTKPLVASDENQTTKDTAPSENANELANDYSYSLDTISQTEEGVYTIEYPMMINLAGELTQDYINQTLKNSAMSMLLPDVNAENPLVVTYEVKRSDTTYLSILYKGLLTWENGAIELWNPVTIDIKSSNLITFDNLVKKDLKSSTEFNSIFSDIAYSKGYEYDKPEDWMGMYLTDQAINYFFMESDFSTEYTIIEIPFESVKAFITIDFGSHPAS